MERAIKKAVGQSKEENPLEKLRKINVALKKLGCRFESERPLITYRKIVGRR